MPAPTLNTPARPTAAAPADAAPMHWALAFMVTALAYALTGIGSLSLAIPPGYAAPLYPPAGVALASVLIFGPRMLPATFLGALCVNLVLASRYEPIAPAMLPVPLVIAGGAVLQAQAGVLLLRRFARPPVTLSEPRDVFVFLLSGAVSCLVSAGIANASLLLSHKLSLGALPFSVATWWVGDLLGVLIGAPVVLALLGRPREAWAPRRYSVGLTLALVTLLLGLAIRQVVQWNDERLRTAFDHEAESAAQALTAQLQEPLQALEALHSVFIASTEVTASELRLATHEWLAPGRLQAMTWSERVKRDEVPAFEARARAQGPAHYRVFDRLDANGTAAVSTAADDEVVAVRLIEPQAPNAGALGVNALSIPATRAAIEAARLTGRPEATAGFRLTQQPAQESQVGVVIYRALFSPEASGLPAASPRRADALRGLVSVVIRLDDQIKALAAQVPSHLSMCLVDVTPGAPPQRLSGAVGCETAQAELHLARPLPYAGRHWQIRVGSTRELQPSAHNADVWLFALTGLLSTAMLGGFLLTVTGRTGRIETAVRERTAALQAEVREREVAEAAMRESEQRFRNILNTVPIGVIYSDLRGNVKQTNPRFCEMTGYSADELLRMTLSDYTHPDDVEQDITLMARLVRGDLPMYRHHKRYIAKNGAIVWVQATVSLLRDANGKPRSIVGVIEDVTEDRKLEEAERAREAAEASNRAKNEFLSRMSHELRTPLNAMLGFAQLLELDPRHPLEPAQQPWVAQIQQAGWHLLEMINDVLDLSRIESGNLRLQLETLNLAELLDATIAMVEGEAQQRGIEISREMAPGASTVLGDGTRVKQILTNLLSNAVKYNAEGGRIHIDCHTLAGDADTIEIAVTDTGLGMTPEQMEDLFQPFNRLGRERSTQQGTGIGLVISQRLAELMGGSLRAHSVAGQGSIFVLTLPCIADPDTVRSDLDALAPEPADYHRRLVHYVEDNETNVEVMRGILAQRPQVEMRVSITGLDGLQAIRAKRPDLVLLDMHLPDISGMELLRHLKADPSTADIPIVVVSADALTQQIDEAFAAGAAHYLTKPVSVSELLGVLDDLLETVETRYG